MNLKIVADLAAPVAFIDFLSLEGALSYAVFREMKGDEYEHVDSIAQLERYELPFMNYWNGLCKISSGFVNGGEFKSIYHKKWDEEYDDVVDFKGNREKITVGTGQLKSYSMPLRVVASPKVVFFAAGEKERISQLLNEYVFFLGKKASQGWGQVRRWRVEEIEADFSVSKDGKPMRPIPLELASKCGIHGKVRYTGFRSPFWNPDNMAACVAPDVWVKADPEVYFDAK